MNQTDDSPTGDEIETLPWVGLSLMASEDFRAAAIPLFEDGEVEMLEWNIDAGWGRKLPGWAPPLLDFYAGQERLVAHGVELSMFSVEWTPRQERWLALMKAELATGRYRHLTEHFGFMTAEGFSGGTPLPLPDSPLVVELGVERLELLRKHAGIPVGLENLAVAFSAADTWAQARMIRDILERTDGFLLLDLHNVLCQAENFDVPALDLLHAYPLERVWQIHIAGGRIVWPSVDPQKRPFRRDSHDEAIPRGAFDLLDQCLPLCPRLESVVVERSDYSIYGDAEIRAFQEEYREIRSRVQSHRASRGGSA